MFKLLKKTLPNSLFGRFLMIILIPNIIIQAVTIYMFYERHWSGVSRNMSFSVAGDVAMVVDSFLSETEDKEKNKIITLAKKNLFSDIYFNENHQIKDYLKYKKANFKHLSSKLNFKLKNKNFHIYHLNNKPDIAIEIQVPKGTLHIEISKKRLANPSTYIFIMWMTGTAIIIILVSILFMRNQVRSIHDLAEFADKFGKGYDSENFKPTGATEVRQASKAFIEMKKRINKHVEQRTKMLAGVSHDLRTPLTRIKLQLAMIEPKEPIKDLENDVIEMEKMIQGYLDFAKGKERVIDNSVNVSDLLRSIISGYRNYHKNIELKSKSGILIHVNSNAFRRAITNIIDNAVRYAKSIVININSTKKNMILTIDDDGIGIPEKQRIEVFKPFYRLDKSRNIESANTGLGLSIAKDIIIGYGGDIHLDNSPLGGLRVVIKMPL